MGVGFVRNNDIQNHLDDIPKVSGDVSMPDELKGELKHTYVDPNAGTGDPTDGRNQYQWVTKYPDEARAEIRWEALYLVALFFVSYIILFAIWKGWVREILSLTPDEAVVFKRFGYYVTSGLLGGVIFGIKYFYRVVARGFWHQDRRIWRVKSPLVAMTVAFFFGTMIESSFISTHGPSSSAAILSIGFLSGYFADDAVAKMLEVANVIFGTSARSKAKDEK